ncbi:MAG: formylglycine-generating enzyme family protein, partial [Planctomycetaceae bacterium]|nr:formylglycine-generating enzyme family protein [Planctomycetaceae bacterium]
ATAVPPWNANPNRRATVYPCPPSREKPPDLKTTELCTQKRKSHFFMSDSEITRGQFIAVMTSKDVDFVDSETQGRAAVTLSTDEERPIKGISWIEAIRFCNALSRAEGRPEFYSMGSGSEPEVKVKNWNASGYRLPTEAEWEFACRGGLEGAFGFPVQVEGQARADRISLDDVAWHKGNSKGEEYKESHRVHQKRRNAFGLFDMHGNVWEWCWDEYRANIYSEHQRQYPSGVLDPRGPESIASIGSRSHVMRGGSFQDPAMYLRSSSRDASDSSRYASDGSEKLTTSAIDHLDAYIGLRVVWSAQTSGK